MAGPMVFRTGPLAPGQGSDDPFPAKGAEHLGAFSIEDLSREFEIERAPGGGCSSHPHVATRKEKRLKQIEKKFLDVRHMDAMDKPAYVLKLWGHGKVVRLVERLSFQYFFFGLVTFYSLVMGAELEFDDEKNDAMWFQVNTLFAMCFMTEAFLKLYSYGHCYFYVRWYVLEFITVMGAFLTLAMSRRGYAESYSKVFVVIKCSRIVLLGKLFSMREEFQVIVLGFTRSLTSLYGVFFVVLVVCYGCTLFCFSVIGKHQYPAEYEAWHHEYFSSVPKIMMTLFSMIIVDEWGGFARPVYQVQPLVVFFFFIFSVLTTLGLLNVVTGMVVETVNSVAEDHAEVEKLRKMASQRDKLDDIVSMLFRAGDGHAIHEEEFESHHQKEDLLEMLSAVDFPTSFTLKDLFTILDWPSHKEIYKEQFVDGVNNFIHGDQFQLDCQLLLSLNRVSRDVIAMRKQMRTVHHHLRHTTLKKVKQERVSLLPAPIFEEHSDEPPLRTDATASSNSEQSDRGSFIGRQDTTDSGGGTEESERGASAYFGHMPLSSAQYEADPGEIEVGAIRHFGEFTMDALTTEFADDRRLTRASSNIGIIKKASMIEKAHTKTGFRSFQLMGVEKMETTFHENPPYYVEGLWEHQWVLRLVQSQRWKLFYGLLVSIFSIMMGLELTYDDEKYDNQWFYMNVWFTMMFMLEVAAKLYSYGHFYFSVPWFVLEFITTWGGAFTLGLKWYGMNDDYKNAFTCLKLSRIILLGKLFSLRREFSVIVLGFTKSLMNLWSIMFVLLVINYGCTLFCYSVIGKHDYSAYSAEEHELYWGSILKTMITLFSMMITDSWGGYSRVVYEEQYPVILFFYIYTIFLTMGLLNVVTGMVCDTVNNVKLDSDKEELAKMRVYQKQTLTDVVELVFEDSGLEITEEEFISHASKGELLEMLEIVDVPHHFTLKDFFTVLDTSGHKRMYKDTFVEGLVSLINSTNFHRECQILLGVHKMRRGVIDLRKELCTIHHRVKHHKPHHGGGGGGASSESARSGEDSVPPTMSSGHGEALQPPLPPPMQSFPQLPRAARNSSPRRQMSPEEDERTLSKDDAAKQNTQIEDMMIMQARSQRPPPRESARGARGNALAAKLPSKLKTRQGDHWDQMRAMLFDTAMEHCVEELQKAWDALEKEYAASDPAMRSGRTPAISQPGSSMSGLQEQWYVRHKLYSAVSRESLHDLRHALDHAQTVGISDRSCAILFTFCDSLSRHQRHVDFSTDGVVEALESGNWIQALDLVVEISLTHGADKTMLLNALARLCADSSGLPAWEPSHEFRQDATATGTPVPHFGGEVVTPGVSCETRANVLKEAVLQPAAIEDVRGRLLAVLHTEAVENASRKLTEAWVELNKAQSAVAGGAAGGFTRGFSPFSRQEELFFLRNQINDAVKGETLAELRRSLNHAMSLGIDPKSIEIEAAYRDALMKHQQGPGFSASYVIQALERGDWWTALDDIIGASSARGADRHTLLKMLAKVVSPTAHLYMPRPALRDPSTMANRKSGNAEEFDLDIEADLSKYQDIDAQKVRVNEIWV